MRSLVLTGAVLLVLMQSSFVQACDKCNKCCEKAKCECCEKEECCCVPTLAQRIAQNRACRAERRAERAACRAERAACRASLRCGCCTTVCCEAEQTVEEKSEEGTVSVVKQEENVETECCGKSIE
jgi:hypothetical protein